MKHSKLGIASTLLPLAIWIYLPALFFSITSCRVCTEYTNYFFKDEGLGALGVLFILMIILVVVIPVCGHILGEGLAIAGIFTKDKKRTFAVIGMILNALPFIGGLTALILYKSGYGFGIK